MTTERRLDIQRRAAELRARRGARFATSSRFAVSAPAQSTPQSEPKKKSRFARLASSINDAVPDEVKTGLTAALSGEAAINLITPGNVGTDIRRQIEKTPVVGGVLGTAFDVGLAPATLLTAGQGGAIGAGLRAGGKAGLARRAAASLIEPVVGGSLPKRYFSEVVMGAAGGEASKIAEEHGAPFPANIGAGILGGIGGLWAMNAVRGASQTFARDAAKQAAEKWGTNLGGREYVADLLDADRVAQEIFTSTDPLERGVLGNKMFNPSLKIETDVGRALNVFDRQRTRGVQLGEIATGAAVDPFGRGARKAYGPGGRLFDIDAETGTVKNVVPNDPKTSTNWYDVFEAEDAPTKYNFTKEQGEGWLEYHKAFNEMRDLLVSKGIIKQNELENPLHVMRIVRGIDNIDVTDINPHEARLYETAAEGAAAGLKYENDPRAVLQTWMVAGYQAIADQQFQAMMAKNVAGASQVLRVLQPGLMKRVTEAGQNFATAVRGGDAAAIRKAKSELTNARNSYTAQKEHLYSKSVFRANEADALREAMPNVFTFGRQGEAMPIAHWKQSFLPETNDFRKLAERVNTMTGKLQPTKLDPFSKSMREIGDTIRFASATGDLAMPFIQGLPLLGQNPILWGKMLAAHTRAFFDPSFAGRYVKDNLATLQEMAQHGVPIGDVEQMIAARSGTGIAAPIKKLAQTKAGVQSIGRLQAAYDTGLTANRLLLWNEMKPLWDGTPEELARYVRNMTGGLDSAALGIGPKQRAIESVWMGFSPRLMRSTMALMASAANPTSPVGRQAARSLLGLAAFATGTFTLANIGVGLAKGESQEEIEKRIKEGLNPLGGRKFLALNINNQYIGVGGQVRAMAQFVAKAIANPSGFATADQFENPLINFYMSRGSVGVNIAGTVAEGASGGRINVLPFEQIDEPADIVTHLGTALLPFAVQSQLEAKDVSTFDRFTMGAFEFGGLRVSEETASKRIDDAAKETYGKPYSELTGREQQQFEEDNAHLIKLRDQERRQYGGFEEKKKQDAIHAADAQRLTAERSLADAFERGIITPEQLRDELKSQQLIAAVRKRDAMGDNEFPTTDANKQALTNWYRIFDESKIPGTEIVDWDTHDALEAEFLATLTPEQRNFIDQRRKPVHAQELDWYYKNEDAIQASNYYGAVETAFNKMKSRLPAEIDTYSTLVLAINRAEASGDRGLFNRLTRVKSQIDRLADRQKEVLRRRNPQLELALQQNRGLKSVRGR